MPGARRGCRRPALSGQRTARPVPWGVAGGSCAEPRKAEAPLLPPPVAAPLRAHSPQGLPPARGRGRGGAPLREREGQARSEAEGVGPARISHAPTCWPPRPLWRDAGRPAARPPPRSARPAPAPSFTSSRSGSPRHPGNAAPRRSPPSFAGGAGLRWPEAANQQPHGPRAPWREGARPRWQLREGGTARPRRRLLGIAWAPRRGEAVSARRLRGREGPCSRRVFCEALPTSRLGLLPAGRCVPGGQWWGVSCTSGAKPGWTTNEAFGSLLSYQEDGGDLLCAPRWFIAGCSCHPVSRGSLGFGGGSLGAADLPQ